MTPRPYQEQLVKDARRAFATLRARGVAVPRVLLQLPTGGGKCLGLGTPVLRFDGTIVPVEDVAPGDLLMGPDSKPRRVLSTARGVGPLYRIKPLRGEPWVCNDVHVLTLVRTDTDEVVDVDLPSYLAAKPWVRHFYKQFSPASGVDFAEPKQLTIDPYFLGVWYGDGTKALHGVAVSKPDSEILALVHEVARKWGLGVRTDGHGSCPTHHLVGVKGSRNALLQELRAIYGAGEFLPHDYLTASREDRAAFLAGLLDSDGYLHNGGYEIVQKRKGFSDGICFLARSLGKKAVLSLKVVDGERYWRVSLSGDFTDLPMRIERKRPIPRRQKKCATRTGFSVEPIGVGEYAGFELDGDGRFLLGDFTITHNTHVLAMLAAGVSAGRVLVLVHRRELLGQARDKLAALGLRVGVIASGLDEDHDAPVLVAMVQTLTARGWVPDDVAVVILDEAHHAPATLWADVLASVGPTLRAFIGLTATPARSGGGLGGSFDVVVCGPSVAELQALGDLVNVRTLRPAKRLTGPAWDALEVLRRHEDRVSCTFVGSVPESRELVVRAAAQGWPLLHVDESTPNRKERLALVGTAYRGVVNQGILTEGWDCPAVSLVVLNRAPGHVTPYLQMAGRGTRPAPGKIDLLLVDMYGVSHDLGLVDEPREWDITEDSGRVAAGRAPGATCKACGMAYGWQPRCPYCGASSPPKPRPRIRWSALSEAEREDRRAAIDPARLWKGLVGKHGRWRAVHVFRGVMRREPTREEMSA